MPWSRIPGLTTERSGELGPPLIHKVSAAATEVMTPEQVHVCLWTPVDRRATSTSSCSPLVERTWPRCESYDRLREAVG
ncbi:hypothetical protein FM21_15240 [Streptomyces mutabilis]|uniref:Uncharacterized protein n=1 Tax=Streptomyces mutabilis TaxID=67332 RepID=A0A086N875_9ACTN|nr:hypothetical protein FM21_15240 [Streptomyces mutabilis]